MPIELKIPEIGESITEVEIGGWLKNKGDAVKKDESVVTLESEKATVELPAPEAGLMGEILKQKGETAKVGEVVAYLEKDGEGKKDGKQEAGDRKQESAGGEPETAAKKPPVAAAGQDGRKAEGKTEPQTEAKPQPAGKASTTQERPPSRAGADAPGQEKTQRSEGRSAESGDERQELVIEKQEGATLPKAAMAGSREEEVVPMSRLRRTVAQRLVEAQHTAALLTTFNEIDMAQVMALRKEHGEAFLQKYNVKLGFMSFFVKACVDALKQSPVVNAEVRGTDIVYHNYYDIGIAVGSGKGLVVPVLRNAERMSFAEIEVAIGDFGRRAKENKLKVEELQDGTFTLSNGGVYGSLLSTPIVNPPQSGVLGMHAIQERPVAREGNVVIRPMMYVALTYDHRVVDGREAVTFLKRIKDVIENPARMLMEV
ncbi:MAG: hypothetical protein QOJ40_980 [Verrucomicrobiota bacterium]